MLYRGRNIDPVKLWSNYCDIKQIGEPFLPLVYCPGHANTRTPAFQINVKKPLVCCFANCGVSGNYAHAISFLNGFYDEFKITDEEIRLAKVPWEPNEPKEIRNARSKVRRAHRKADKIIFQLGLVKGGEASETFRNQSRCRRSGKIKSTSAEWVEGVGSDLEAELGNYRYLPKEAIYYLEKVRDITPEIRTRFELGFDEEEERITLPARDLRDRLQFFIKRAILTTKNAYPPYLYPSGSVKSSLLYGAGQADKAMIGSKGIILVEGAFDCLRLHQWGYTNTVALLGNSLSLMQRRIIAGLQPKVVYLFMDKDYAGVCGIEKASRMLPNYPLRVPLYPKRSGNLDPASLSRREVDRAIREAITTFKLNRRRKCVV